MYLFFLFRQKMVHQLFGEHFGSVDESTDDVFSNIINLVNWNIMDALE